MQKSFIEPDDQTPSPYYSNAISVIGGRTLYVSGQTAYDEKNQFNEKDGLEQQIDKSLSNLRKVLQAGGATPEHVVMIHVYVKNYDPEKHLSLVTDKLKALFPGPKLPCSTLLGVQSLARVTILFEIEAIAVIPE